MENPYQPPQSELLPPPPAKRDAMHFWRRGLLYYNGAQLLVTAGFVLAKLPGSMIIFSAHRLGGFAVFALISNGLYCAALLVEVALLIAIFRPYARIARLVCLILGTTLACCIAGVVLDMVLLRPLDD